MPQSRDPKYSDQTVLMLAVRDRRDRAAFGKLFDYFAPRLKASPCDLVWAAAQRRTSRKKSC